MSSLTRLIASGARLPPAARREAWRALGWLVLAHAMLLTLPYPAVRRTLERLSRPRRSPYLLAPADCARAIDRAHVLFPVARCLTRALAAECLLRRAGRAPRVVLGVGFGEDRAFEAHAWLECDGAIVIGAAEASRYTPLPS